MRRDSQAQGSGGIELHTTNKSYLLVHAYRVSDTVLVFKYSFPTVLSSMI